MRWVGEVREGTERPGVVRQSEWTRVSDKERRCDTREGRLGSRGSWGGTSRINTGRRQ